MSSGMFEKLVPNLIDKTKYTLQYRNLQLYLDLGLKLKKVHRVLRFTQSPWLKKYIDFNTKKRTLAKKAFEKDFFKLMNNSVFGKTMENIRKHVEVRLVTDERKSPEDDVEAHVRQQQDLQREPGRSPQDKGDARP